MPEIMLPNHALCDSATAALCGIQHLFLYVLSFFPPPSAPTADISETLGICPRSLSRQASSQLPSIGTHPLFYDGHCILWWEHDVPKGWVGYGAFIAIHHVQHPAELEGSGALGSNWLELTLPGPLTVCTSRAFHVAHISLRGFWLYRCAHLFSFTTVFCHN